MNMIRFLNRQKRKIEGSRHLAILLAIVSMLTQTCAQKEKGSEQVETVAQALEFLQNQDSIKFYALIDTSFLIDLRGREGMSNEFKHAAYFLKKFGAPDRQKYKVVNYEPTDYKSAQIVVPIIRNDTSDVKDVDIIFEFVKFLPQTKALYFHIEIQTNPNLPMAPIRLSPKNQ
jgi:hypothetical protein